MFPYNTGNRSSINDQQSFNKCKSNNNNNQFNVNLALPPPNINVSLNNLKNNSCDRSKNNLPNANVYYNNPIMNSPSDQITNNNRYRRLNYIPNNNNHNNNNHNNNNNNNHNNHYNSHNKNNHNNNNNNNNYSDSISVLQPPSGGSIEFKLNENNNSSSILLPPSNKSTLSNNRMTGPPDSLQFPPLPPFNKSTLSNNRTTGPPDSLQFPPPPLPPWFPQSIPPPPPPANTQRIINPLNSYNADLIRHTLNDSLINNIIAVGNNFNPQYIFPASPNFNRLSSAASLRPVIFYWQQQHSHSNNNSSFSEQKINFVNNNNNNTTASNSLNYQLPIVLNIENNKDGTDLYAANSWLVSWVQSIVKKRPLKRCESEGNKSNELTISECKQILGRINLLNSNLTCIVSCLKKIKNHHFNGNTTGLAEIMTLLNNNTDPICYCHLLMYPFTNDGSGSRRSGRTGDGENKKISGHFFSFDGDFFNFFGGGNKIGENSDDGSLRINFSEENHLKMADFIKTEITNLKSLLGNEQVGSIKCKLVMRRKKRERNKRKSNKDFEERRELEKEKKLMDRLISQWQEDIATQELTIKEKLELTEIADELLAEVRQKLNEANKSVKTLLKLSTLRETRIQKMSRREASSWLELNSDTDVMFKERYDSLMSTLGRQIESYQSEEKTLKVMLDMEQEVDIQIDKRKKKRKWKQDYAEYKRLLTGYLFGNSQDHHNSQTEDILKPIRSYFRTDEVNLGSLMQIRQEWDGYLVPENFPAASNIPIKWVEPSQPTNQDWKAVLKK